MRNFNRNPVIMLLVILCVIFFIPTLYAQNESENPIIPAISSPGKSISEFLTPDGRFDIEKARISGFQGSFDMDGFKPVIDPSNGQPVFCSPSTNKISEDPDDIYWDNSMSSSVPGVRGYIKAFAEYNGKMIAGGGFTEAGEIEVNYIAAWDGTSWFPLGEGLNGIVNALTVYDGKLIVGGQFTSAGGELVNNIAAWDGNSWAPLGEGMDERVSALVVYNGKLVAGGMFKTAGGIETNCIAIWDGSTWMPLGSGVNGSSSAEPSQVNALIVYDGKLVVGGNFINAGEIETNYIASWDGSIWAPFGLGFDSYVNSFTIYGNKLIVGGNFTLAGGIDANNVASWDGFSWMSLGGGMSNPNNYPSTVFSLSVYMDKIIAGGWFTFAEGVSVNGIAAWDGSSWSPLGQGMDSSVYALIVYEEDLFAGGEFYKAGDAPVNSIAFWDGSLWVALGKGFNEHINALICYNGKLIAGGFFGGAGGVKANYVAEWDGFSWSPLGSGMNDQIKALTIYKGKLIAGGRFTSAGGADSTGYVASWDGFSWLPLGSGLNGEVWSLTVYNDNLIAAGDFSYTFRIGGNTITMNNIASWDGSSWLPLGGGYDSGVDKRVRALAVYDGKLIVGGRLTSAGGVNANRIASWDGLSWSPLGLGVDYYIYSLTIYNGKLIAGGSFTSAGGKKIKNIALWDGNTWSSLGSGINGDVFALTVYEDKLIAGGYFTDAGGVAVNKITLWDGLSWSSLGSGISSSKIDSYINALTVYNESLIVGGIFSTAGGKIAPYIAAWTKRDSVGVSEQSEVTIPQSAKITANYPNPFNPSTTIDFSVPSDSKVTIKIYNLNGQEIATLKDEMMTVGKHSVMWSAKDMPSGVYFCTVKAGTFSDTRKMTLLK